MAKQLVVLSVEGMSCQHCVNAIRKAVGALNGVQRVEVDLQKKEVTVDFDSAAATLTAIKEAIEDQGYEVK